MDNIVRIAIKNFLSLVDVEIRPGKITQIVGDNNQGKTSILKALNFAVQGSTDPTLVRLGEDSAEVLMELPDETVIRRRINSQGRQSVTVSRGEFETKAPQGLLNALFDQSSFNPLELMDPKARTEAIMKSIEIPMSAEILAELLGIPKEDLPPLDYEQHGLKVLEQAYGYYYQRRAEANKTLKEKKTRWETYKKDLPQVPPAPPLNRAEIQVEKNERTQLISEEKSRLAKIAELKRTAQSRTVTLNNYIAEAQKIDNQIANLEQQLMTAKARRNEAEKFIEKARAEVQTEFPPEEPHQKAIAAMEREIQEYDLMVKEHEKLDAVNGQIKMVSDLEGDVTKAQAFADLLSGVVETLHGPAKKKVMAAAEMPVTGLEYRDGGFFVDGVAVDNLSSSSVVRLALAVARKLAKKAKVICLDGAEALDAKTWALLCAETKDDGFSYFVTRVGEALPADGPVLKMQEGQVVQ